MKKILLFISLIVTASTFFACDKQKTAQEMLKEERKSIGRFISNNEIIETNDTAQMHQDKVYYKTKEGLYIHVINRGNGNKAKYDQKILVRYSDLIYFNDTTKYSNMSSKEPSLTFNYNNSYTYGGSDGYDLSCAGLSIGLGLVSENAEVSLIVPSELQSSFRQGFYQPIYFGFLKYRFE